MDNRLEALRLERDLSRGALARALSMSESSIYKWEVGQSQMSLTSLFKLAAVLQVQPADILPALCTLAQEEVRHAG